MGAIVRDDDVTRLARGLQPPKELRQLWRRMMKMRLDVEVRGRTTNAGMGCAQ